MWGNLKWEIAKAVLTIKKGIKLALWWKSMVHIKLYEDENLKNKYGKTVNQNKGESRGSMAKGKFRLINVDIFNGALNIWSINMEGWVNSNINKVAGSLSGKIEEDK